MLSAQQALALVATGVSQHQISAYLGVSYRTVGRWLRQGQPDGAKAIPQHAYKPIAALARLFRDAARDQAAHDGIPFSEEFPVFAYRYLNVPEEDGIKNVQNLRMFVDNTEFIDPLLRRQIFATFWITREFIRATIGSLINWLKYVETRELTHNEVLKIRHLQSVGKQSGALFNPDISQSEKIKILERQNIIRQLWLKAQETHCGVFCDEHSFNVLFYDPLIQRLKDRHEPNAVILSNKYLFQLATEQYKQEKERSRRNTQTPYKKAWNDSKRNRRNKRGK